MGTANFSVSFSAVLSSLAGTVSPGVALVKSGSSYVVATSANRTALSRRADGIALDAGSSGQSIRVQHDGLVTADITGLGAGVAGWVEVNASGLLARIADGDIVDGTTDLIGRCTVTGDMHVMPNAPTSLGGGTATNDGAKVEVAKEGTSHYRTLEADDSQKKSLVQKTNTVSVKASPPGVFNVCDYGADPTGATDSTTAFNAAIAAANAAALTPGSWNAGAGIVYLPDGKYKLLGALTRLQPCVWLVGAMRPNPFGSGGVLVESYHDDTLLYLAEFNDNQVATHNGVRNIHFRCKHDQSAALNVLDITDATNATPIVIESVGHGYTTGDVVRINRVLGNTGANGRWTITVIDADTFSLDTSVGVAAYTSGGKVFNETTEQANFDTNAAACIENRGGLFCEVENCTIEGYPLGVILDGAASCLIKNCNITTTPDSSGYQAWDVAARGIWLVDGAARGRGFTVGGATDNNHIVGGQYSGNHRDMVIAAVNNVVDGPNFEGVHAQAEATAIEIAGGTQIVIQNMTSEGYIGRNARLIHVTAALFQFGLYNNFLGGQQRGLKVDSGASINLMVSHNNRWGAPAGQTSVKGVNRIIGWAGLAEYNPQSGLAFSDNFGAAAAGIMIARDGIDDVFGLGVNMTTPAQAILHGFVLDNAKSFFRVDDAEGVTRYDHSSASRQKHSVGYNQIRAVTGHKNDGAFYEQESADVEGDDTGPSTVDMCAHDLPANDAFVTVRFSIQQWSQVTATDRLIVRGHRYGRWVGGTLTWEDASTVYDEEDGGNTLTVANPTVEETSGVLSIRVDAHATDDTRATVHAAYVFTVL